MATETSNIKEMTDTYPIGTKFRPIGGKHEHTVVDVWKTYNSAGDLVRVRYVAEHLLCGQTIARGLLS